MLSPPETSSWSFLKPKSFKVFGNLPKSCSPEPYSAFSFLHKEIHPGCHMSVTKKQIYRSQKGKDIYLGTFLKLWTKSLFPFWQVLEPTCQVLRSEGCLWHGINCVKVWGPAKQQPRKHLCTPTVLGNLCTVTHCDFLCIYRNMVFKKMSVLIENWLADSVSSTINSSSYLIYLITESGLMIYIIILYFIEEEWSLRRLMATSKPVRWWVMSLGFKPK